MFVIGDNFLKGGGVDDCVVALLLEGDAVNLAGFEGIGVVVGVDLEDAVLAALFLLEDGEGLGFVAWSNDTVRDFFRDDLGGGEIDNVGECDPVAKGGHAVGAAGTGVGVCEGREVFNVGDKVEFLFCVRKGKAYGGSGRRDVFEGGSGGEGEGSREFLDEGPRVEGVEEVDVTGGAGEDLEGKVSQGHKCLGGFLVGVGAVTKRKHCAVLGVLFAEEVGNGGVVLGGLFKGLKGESVAGVGGNGAGSEFLDEDMVVDGIREDGDTGVVLCSGTKKSDTSNVNFLDGLVDGDIYFGDGFLEGVKIANDKVDLVDALCLKIFFVGLNVAGENAWGREVRFWNKSIYINNM